ncbi:DEAD/DEAH box helicase [Paenibacillus marchantiophytorum]|uniref:DEAD/DEAH box helicase n=1 Tax=Paenibacillus marchantiophytorum TaxID=1619310 RepID=A0ABQ1FD91_9BACL|nr:DEAD/DEAH box helicase [Paenibacillus marchantiophytorum]GGA05691.1 DEAD/DEAH box helicase [Paenibacillus marchantiophytorum]
MTNIAPELSHFHPILTAWFSSRFGEPTDVQKQAWNAIRTRAHTLISSPTGSGKTLAALLPGMDQVVHTKQALGDAYVPGVRVLVVTPLKALNNDIHDHLIHFTGEIEALAASLNHETAWRGLRVGVRTGDTPQSTRASMLKQPPDLLVTTPESLYLLLTSSRARDMLKSVEQIVVDEIHDLAADKRGMHLSLTLERLGAWCGRSVQRIGVSATQKPIQRVAQFLGGWEADQPRQVRIIESKAEKQYALQVTMPEPAKAGADKEAIWTPLVERLLQLMEGCSTVLIFANSRRLCERITLRLNDHVGHEIAKSHHGSVAREKRLEVERMLKAGELRCLVATSSLELGIDVGHVELVIQLDSPFSAAAGIQRIGRAGHAVGSVSRGVLLARSRSLLPELAVLSRRIAARDIEDIRIPRGSLDVLAQQLVAMTAMGDELDVARLGRLLAQSDSFHELPEERWLAMLEVLSGLYPFVRPLIAWNRETGSLERLAATQMAALTGAGTIPQSTAYPVHHNETGLHLGELDEEFIHESSVGDVFQLGTASWRIVRKRPERIYVQEAENRYSEIPFWRGESGGKSFELGVQTGHIWRELRDRLQVKSRTEADIDVQNWLEERYYFDAEASQSLISLVRNQLAVNAVPTDATIVIESFVDENNQAHTILHSLFGRKLNRSWLMGIEKHLKQQGLTAIYANAKDNGIELIFPSFHDALLPAILSMTPEEAEQFVIETVAESGMFGAAFQRLAETSLLLSRSFTRVPAWIKRLRGQELMKEALPFKERFPLFQEAMRECLEDHVDLPNLRNTLTAIQTGDIQIAVHRNHFPSPLAAQFKSDYVAQKIYESDALSEDLQVELLGFSRQMAAEIFGTAAIRNVVSPQAIEAEEHKLTKTDEPLSSTGEVLRFLKERGDSSLSELVKVSAPDEPWIAAWIDELLQEGKIAATAYSNETRYLCSDELDFYGTLSEDAVSRAFIFQRFADGRLSFTKDELVSRFEIEPGVADHWIQAALESQTIAAAPFAEADTEELWTSSKVASRLIRMSLQSYRRGGGAISPSTYLAHMPLRRKLTVLPEISGMEQLLSIITDLQGFFLPVSHWESLLFPSRQLSYRKQDLDTLCSSGQILWMGRKEPDEKEGRIAFFLSDHHALLAPCLADVNARPVSQPYLLHLLQEKGASFLSKLGIETGKTPSSLLEELLQLVWDGQAANDQFAPLRLHAMGASKKPEKFQSGLGRWYALQSVIEPAFDKQASAMQWTHHLLERFGLVTKSVVSTYCPFPWESIQTALRQLEEWGLVVRGLFITDLHALQFATKEFISLLHQQPAAWESPARFTLLSAVDPANPYGLLLDWPAMPGISFSRKQGNYLALQGSEWLYWIENNGKRIYHMPSSSSPVSEPAIVAQELKSMFRQFLKQHHLRKIVIDTWNGVRISEAPEQAYLKLLGAEKDRTSFVLWPSQLS